MPQPTIHLIDTYNGKVWRVCCAGMCKDHAQQWQAMVFWHQMSASTGEPARLDLSNKKVAL
jgi:hypothetical protein